MRLLKTITTFTKAIIGAMGVGPDPLKLPKISPLGVTITETTSTTTLLAGPAASHKKSFPTHPLHVFHENEGIHPARQRSLLQDQTECMKVFLKDDPAVSDSQTPNLQPCPVPDKEMSELMNNYRENKAPQHSQRTGLEPVAGQLSGKGNQKTAEATRGYPASTTKATSSSPRAQHRLPPGHRCL